ncbi:hypothetical protein VT84_07290 [Gemmata sp. SH-PL17]|uniref:hypothetical protein n=1 Tax=Gemmata sp. SH-PL17 TaxID=1630693 RepID=UPI00078D05F8|nr:hypothetical protein [Gemmata sp. SH-PL17]AMV24184.1 hypothetical protein VT84_07290 [Gemmata sp. SH-PL17]
MATDPSAAVYDHTPFTQVIVTIKPLVGEHIPVVAPPAHVPFPGFVNVKPEGIPQPPGDAVNVSVELTPAHVGTEPDELPELLPLDELPREEPLELLRDEPLELLPLDELLLDELLRDELLLDELLLQLDPPPVTMTMSFRAE